MPLTVTAGVEAVFTCRHSEADFIAWKVNNESVRQAMLPGISTGTGTLTIVGLPEYNGTVVECVGLFLDGSPPVTAPPVRLTVQGRALSSYGITVLKIILLSK